MPPAAIASDSVPVADLALPNLNTTDSNGEGLTIGHIGRYALKQQLGEGGLGTVHSAYDPILSRTIAVKTLHLNVAEGDRAALDALFLNEARAAAGLNHPNIVTVYDAGLSEQGVYIAMERLRGRDLRQLLNNGWHPDIVQTAQIVRRVADALAYAHSKGVIHCDIKPANIFMVGRTLPKVVDFGIARVANGQVISALEGVVAGSPHYLAPEQLRGETVDRRCDVYSLGVVMYELLTHRKAFNGETLAEIVNAVQNSAPPPAHELRPGVPVTLSKIAARAMAQDPTQRFRSARQLSQELRQWLETEGELASDESGAAPKRRKVPLIAAGASVVVAGLVAGYLWLQSPDAASTQAQQTPVPAAVIAAPEPLPVAASTVIDSGDTAGQSAPGSEKAKAAQADDMVKLAAANAARDAQREQQARKTLPTPKKQATATPAVAPITGVVQLAISPWGQVEIDGASAGVTPPLSRLQLSVGEHVITVRNEDFPPYTTTVKVNADQPVVIRHRFGS